MTELNIAAINDNRCNNCETNTADNVILNVIETMDFIIVYWLMNYLDKLYPAIMKGT